MGLMVLTISRGGLILSLSRIGYSICLAMTLICLAYGILFGVACLISSPVEWYKLDVQSIEGINALKVFYPSLSLFVYCVDGFYCSVISFCRGKE
jgi:hypothetical protein